MHESLFQRPFFLDNAVIYEVNIRQYSAEGTFNAFAAHLPRLKDMGVNILWLMPIHPIGKIKRKGTLGSYYSIQDHKAVNPEFGTDTDLKALVTKAHALGMKIILDWVANHTAWDHVWTVSNPDFFEHDDAGNFKPPYDWDDVIQIDHANKNEQEAMIDAMQYWITGFDIDGFRADLAHLTPLRFWKDARTKLSACKKDLLWLAETEEVSYHEAFDISYTWEWMHATEKFARKELGLPDCIAVLEKYKIDFPAAALRLFFTSNHDENSWNGTEYEKYGLLAKALAVFSFTYPGVSLIYSGQELPNKKRLKFFDKDEIEWGSGEALHGFYKTLSALRRRNKAISNPEECIFLQGMAEQNILAYKISRNKNCVLVFLNMASEAVSLNISLNDTHGKFRDIFSGEIVELNKEYFFTGGSGDYRVLEKIFPADFR